MAKRERIPSLYRLPSGRGIKVLELLPSERRESMARAAETVGVGATAIKFNLAEAEDGTRAMVRAFTASDGFASTEALLDPAVKWIDATPESLMDIWDDIFTSKDDALLSSLFRSLHDASRDDMETLQGKALKVSAG